MKVSKNPDGLVSTSHWLYMTLRRLNRRDEADRVLDAISTDLTLEILRLERRRRLAHVAAWSIAAFFSAVAVTTGLLIPRVEEFWWGHYPRYSLGVGAVGTKLFGNALPERWLHTCPTGPPPHS
jgi:hypothetical protein